MPSASFKCISAIVKMIFFNFYSRCSNIYDKLSVYKPLLTLRTVHIQLTVNLVGKQLSIDHPVGIKEHAADQEPGELFILIVYGLSDDTKTDHRNKHYYHKVGHIP